MSAASVLAGYLAEEYDTEDEDYASMVANQAIAALTRAGYRVAKQEKVVRWLSIAERDEVLWRDLP